MAKNRRIKVCFIAEGCYPYEIGGVSSWIHSIINTFPDIDFSLIAIIASRETSGKFKYKIPDNLVSIYEVYLNDYEYASENAKKSERKFKLSKDEISALHSLVSGDDVDWECIFNLFAKKKPSVDKLLMGKDFLDVIIEFYKSNYHSLPFTDFLWNMRSIYLTLFLSMRVPMVDADIYHCVATGYAGIIGPMQKVLHPGSKLLISEHGIYTREREEEIIRAKWVKGIFKDIWINQFRKMSLCAYNYAELVTSLFEHARQLQIELGCPKEKTVVTPNGVKTENFIDIPGKDPSDDYFNIGAILRVTPIKDVKTMITAFHYAHQTNPHIKLWIMGPSDEDPEYFKECQELVSSLNASDIIFTGVIKTVDYIGKMDALILTSISEGQPLTILEGFAASKPSIATNVGNCSGLIYGESDNFGSAGIVVPVMSIPDIVKAILTLSENEKLCKQMGEIGKKRVFSKYKIQDMKNTYEKIYNELSSGCVTPSKDNQTALEENDVEIADVAGEMQSSFDILKDQLLK